MNKEITLVSKLMQAFELWSEAYQDIKEGINLIGHATDQPMFIDYVSAKVSAFSNENKQSNPNSLLLLFNLPDGVYHLSVLVFPPEDHSVNIIEFNIAICSCIEMFCYLYNFDLTENEDAFFEFEGNDLVVNYSFFGIEFSIMFGKN